MDKDGKKLWFRAKTYGYGWTPCSSEGWLVTLLYILAIECLFFAIDQGAHSVSDALIGFAAPFAVLTYFFIVICIFKGEKARWRWGRSS